jgi:hypothetical protein
MSTIVAQTLSNGTVSTSTANCIQGSAKAWVKFTNTGSAGTINGSYNVSSVTYRGTGQTTVNLTNAFADTNYSIVYTVGNTRTAGGGQSALGQMDDATIAPTSSAIPLISYTTGGTTVNLVLNNVAVFR